ncbi:MAG: alpha-2-macroglobulin family protein, partial [Candidatus Hodarchaeales archaeon]
MTKFYTRIPKKLSEKGTIYRIFNGIENEIKIKQKSKEEETKFNLKKYESKSKYFEGSQNALDWIITEKGEKNEWEKEKISLKLKPFKAEELGAIWLPKNKYRPGDKVKGYIFLRKKPLKGSNVLKLITPDERNPVVLELVDSEKNTIKVIPITKLDQPIIYFEIEIGKYNETGDYNLQLKKGKKNIHDLLFSVAHYDKPDIEIFINLPKWKLVGETIKCNIQSKYYHGEPVSTAKVTLSSEGFEEEIETVVTNGTVDITLPDLLTGIHSITATVEDENDRKATSKTQINIVEEPIQLVLSTNPDTRPFIENQSIEINVKAINPINIPISDKKVQCKLVNEKQEDFLKQQVFITDNQGYVTISDVKLKQGNYVFSVLVQTDAGPFVSLVDQFFVRKPTEEDFWLQFVDIPNAVYPDETVNGKIVLIGPGIRNISTKEVYLDIITDRILDTKKYELKDTKLDEITIPITLEIPNDYHGELEIESYLNPIISESFEQKIEKTPNDWFGESFSFPKTSTKKKIEILRDITKINFEVETLKEVATGTNFDIRISFEDNYSKEENLWVGVALTDERVLLDYQPITPSSIFNKPTNAVEILTIGSKQEIKALPPRPVKFAGMMVGAEMDKGTGAGPIRRMMKLRQRKESRKFQATLGAGFDEVDDSLSLNYLEFASVSDKLETPLVQQVVRTEFPEDIVNRPEKVEGDYNLEIRSPDSITRYKIFVIACNETHFGVEERSIVVKNPIFTSTLNPPEMTLGDRISLQTVIENLSSEKLKDITITANTNENLKIHNRLIQKLKELKAKEKINVFWDIEASKVGDVELSTLLESKYFSEFSELQ